MVLHASGARHMVEPVSEGQRDAAINWVQSLIRDPQQRAMLFELDPTIQHQAAESASHQSVLSLIGLYHDPLRLRPEP